MSTIKQNVFKLLKDNPKLRDNDNQLILHYYFIYGGHKKLSFINWFQENSGTCKSIERQRRLIQAANPKLRGKSYKIRKAKAEIIRQKAINKTL